MKQTIASLGILFLVSSLVINGHEAMAQEHVRISDTDLEVRYLEKVMVDTTERRIVTDTMILKLSGQLSSFYSKDLHFVDSLEHTENGLSKMRQLQFQYARQGRISDLTANTGEYIYYNYPTQGKMTTRASVPGSELVEFEEDVEIPWVHEKGAKTILGYSCVKASADFRGRHWTVWYSYYIPYVAGPWKLRGMPGVILEAFDDKGEYSYEAVSISRENLEDMYYYDWSTKNHQYIKTDRITYLKTMNGEAFINADDMRQVGLGSLSTERKYDYRETDYHKT